MVVCAETLLPHIPPDLEAYSAVMLWKSLRAPCCAAISQIGMAGHELTLWTLPTREDSGDI